MNINCKNFECDCGCLFTTPKEINNSYDEFIHHKTLGFVKTLQEEEARKQDAMDEMAILERKHPDNTFKLVKIKDESEIIHYEIQMEMLEAVIKQNGVYLIACCPKCNKEAYRCRL